MTVPFKKESHRKERVEGLILQCVSQILLQELSDPRCGFCTVTKVRLSRDLKSANVFVSILGEAPEQRNTMRALKHARGFVQKRLFEELSLRYPPVISFHMDHGIEHSVKISRILREEGVSGDVDPAEPTSSQVEDEAPADDQSPDN